MKTGSKRGFTLIEVMVATGIMLVMVLMLGSLFRQATSSWDSGYVRAEGGMVVRGVLGAISRDLYSAVDGRRYEKSWSDPIKAEGSTLEFYCLKPCTLKRASGSDLELAKGDIFHVVYNIGSTVTRKETSMRSNASTSTTLYDQAASGIGGSSEFKAEFKVYANDGAAVSSRPYETKSGTAFVDGDTKNGAYEWAVGGDGIASVRVRLTLTRSGTYSGVTVVSLGPDGYQNGDSESKEEDDIVVR